MPLSACQAIDQRLTLDMVQALSVETCVAARNHTGGTAPEQVRLQCAKWMKQFND
jgi:argininosuccinate lyase